MDVWGMLGFGVLLCLCVTVELVSSVYSVNRKHIEDLLSALRIYSTETTEMEFLNGKLAEVSGHKLEYSPTQVFVWFSILILQNAIHE